MNEGEILDTFFEKNHFFIGRDEVSLELVPARLRGDVQALLDAFESAVSASVGTKA